MTEKLHVRIAPDGTIEVKTENVAPEDIAALVPVLEAMLKAKAISARTAPVAPKPAARQRHAKPLARR